MILYFIFLKSIFSETKKVNNICKEMLLVGMLLAEYFSMSEIFYDAGSHHVSIRDHSMSTESHQIQCDHTKLRFAVSFRRDGRRLMQQSEDDGYEQPPAFCVPPGAAWFLSMYVRDVWSRLPLLKATITSTYGVILKMDSTKKVTRIWTMKLVTASDAWYRLNSRKLRVDSFNPRPCRGGGGVRPPP